MGGTLATLPSSGIDGTRESVLCVGGSPFAGELERPEACLWVIPGFLKRAEDRKPDVYEYAFKGMTGGLSLDLSWVPKERLRPDRPGRTP